MSSMRTSTVKLRITMLQFALGFLVHEQELIEHLYQYRVTTLYKVRTFKTSACSRIDTRTALKQNNESIQGVSDNFDTNLNTQSGLKQTHFLATFIT